MAKKLSKKMQARCEMLYKTGLEMFLQNGYEQTNLADIVKITGGSLSTIYQRFGNKEGFFEAIVFKGVEEFYEKLEKKLSGQSNKDLKSFLYQFGVEYIEIFCDDRTIALGRILYSEGYKDNGKLFRRFIQKIETIIHGVFMDYFEKYKFKDMLKSDDYEKMAIEFCLLIREPDFTYYMADYKPNDLTKEQKNEKVARIVDFFLHGYKNTKENK